MREELARELLALDDSLPQRVNCPYCATAVEAWPTLLAELDRTAGEAGREPVRACPSCASRLTIDGAPQRFSDPLGLRMMARALARGVSGLFKLGGCLATVVAFPLLIGSALWWAAATPHDRILVAAAVVAAALIPICGYGPWRKLLARRRWEAERDRRWKRIGAGDTVLGEHLTECDQRIRQLVRQVRDRDARTAVVRAAREKLERSSFRERAAPYRRAVQLLDDQVREREHLLADFLAYRRDLEALVAVRRAETAFEAGTPITDAADLDEERSRLADAVDRLMAAAELDETLASLPLGEAPEGA